MSAGIKRVGGRWPRGSAVAWDKYLNEPVEVCEPDGKLDVVVCRRIYPHPDSTGTSYESNSDGVMIDLPSSYFHPLTPLARELLKLTQAWRQ